MNQMEGLEAIAKAVELWRSTPCKIGNDDTCRDCASGYLGVIASILSQTEIIDYQDKVLGHATALVSTTSDVWKLRKKPVYFRVRVTRDPHDLVYTYMDDETTAQNLANVIHGDSDAYEGLYIRDGKVHEPAG